VTAYTDIRSAIVTRLEAVSNIGLVHNRGRFASQWDAFFGFFKSTIGGTAQIRGWQVRRESARVLEERPFGDVRREHLFILEGIQGLKDGSDTAGTFQALCDTVMATFDDESTMGVTGVIRTGPCSLRSFEDVQFGSVLVHLAEIEVPVEMIHAAGVA
jgi:hypothetical protein